MFNKTGLSLNKAIRDLKIGGRVAPGEELKNYTTLRIGGPAEIFITPFSLEELKKIVNFVKENAVPLFILGGGSKVLIPDKGLKGITLKLDAPFFKKINFYDGYVKLGCGVKVNEFLDWMLKNSFGGWEFLAGIPACIGGAVSLNAGIKKGPCHSGYIQIGDFVESLTVIDSKGEVFTLDKNDLKFSYRESNLSAYIILEVRLGGLIAKNRETIQQEIKKFLAYRKKTQELGFPSAGCVFKNPVGDRRGSGELIELSGLKGKRIGDIVISDKHTNFMLNMGHGKAEDFIYLMELVQKKVKLDHNIWLEPEIRILKMR